MVYRLVALDDTGKELQTYELRRLSLNPRDVLAISFQQGTFPPHAELEQLRTYLAEMLPGVPVLFTPFGVHFLRIEPLQEGDE